MLETSVSPRAEADEEQVSDRLYAMTERFGRNVDNAGEIRADQQQCRELGLAFVSETEAQALIAKLADASPEES
jgi:hypothetical protein